MKKLNRNEVTEKLRTPEVLEFIGSEASLSVPWSTITKKVKEKFEIDTNPITIKKTYDIYATRRSELVAQDPKLKNAITKQVLDSSKQLESINSIMWDLVGKLKDSADQDDVALVIKLAKEIREQIKINNDMSKSFMEKLDPSKINKIEYTKVVINSLKELEDSGIITINKDAADALHFTDLK